MHGDVTSRLYRNRGCRAPPIKLRHRANTLCGVRGALHHRRCHPLRRRALPRARTLFPGKKKQTDPTLDIKSQTLADILFEARGKYSFKSCPMHADTEAFACLVEFVQGNRRASLTALWQFVQLRCPWRNWYVHRYWLFSQVRHLSSHAMFNHRMLLQESVPTDCDLTVTMRRARDGARMAVMWRGQCCVFHHSASTDACLLDICTTPTLYPRILSLRYNGSPVAYDMVLLPGATRTVFGRLGGSAFEHMVQRTCLGPGAATSGGSIHEFRMSLSCRIELSCHAASSLTRTPIPGGTAASCVYPPLFHCVYTIHRSGPRVHTLCPLAKHRGRVAEGNPNRCGETHVPESTTAATPTNRPPCYVETRPTRDD